ncbi:MAG: XdhC family protein [Gemmatimonadaceae bacterium]|nr:XdhC family protein [Gemmatimonadaceae bacterium]
MADSRSIPTGPAAVATLIATEGTSPKEAGAKMWVDASGAIVGAVTIGGCVDARVIEESARVLAEGKPTVLRMSLGDEDAWALGMTCGGSIEVLIEPVNGDASDDSISRAMRVARDEVEAGRRVVIATPLDGSADRLVVFERGQRAGTLGDPALDAAAMGASVEYFTRGRSGTSDVTLPSGTARLYFELHAPPGTLVVFGATHVAMPLVEMARVLGLRTVVVDGRERFATRERFPTADELIVGMPSEIAARLPLGRHSFVVLLSHDYKYDLPVLRAVLESDAAYVGCLGSVRRGKAMLDFLAEQGVPQLQLSRVRIPVGLDIGARSAAEIALSALAEALAVERGRGGGAMRDRAPRSGGGGEGAVAPDTASRNAGSSSDA